MSELTEARWLPLESNPDVMNTYVKALGGPKKFQFTDVYGFDPELLMMVPRPCAAVMLLYPITEKSESKMIGEVEENKDVYFTKQTIGNACGTIGLIHSLLGNSTLQLPQDGHLKKYFDATKDMSPEERAAHLEKDEGFNQAHEACALKGQTKAPSRDEKVDLHFVAFVERGGTLYELDGRRKGPVNHGKTTPDTLLEDAVTVVKKFIERDPDSLQYNVIALAAQMD